MSRLESTIVGFVAGIMCPVSLFILLWWLTAALTIYHLLPISDHGIAIVAFTGLGIGIVLDILYLKNWIIRFYDADIKLMMLIYLFWSFIVLAFFMGLPFGTLALGTLAGIYVGRKQCHAEAKKHTFTKAAKNVSIFTALITGAESLPIGFLGLHEPIVVEPLRTITGLEQTVITGPIGIGLVGLGCILLMVIQFYCTRTAVAFAFRSGKNTL